MGEVAGLTGVYLLVGATFGENFGSGDCNMNKPHLRSAIAAGVGPAVAVDGLLTTATGNNKKRIARKDVLRQVTEGCGRWRSTLEPRSRRNFPSFIFHF